MTKIKEVEKYIKKRIDKMLELRDSCIGRGSKSKYNYIIGDLQAILQIIN